MDPLTHTLFGANLSATRLGQKTRFAAAALIVGANLPDIDGICYLIDSDLALGFRRGWTHGVLALIILPLVLASLLQLFDRPRGGERRTNFKWLVALSAIGIWSHPALDWLNTYGVRLLMPFDGRWFYGDSVFIMDLWLWLILGCGYLAGCRATPGVIVPGLIIAAWVVRTVARRSTEYLPLVIGVMLLFAVMLLWQLAVRRPDAGRRFAVIAVALAMTYIAARIALNEATEAAATRHLRERGEAVTAIMAGPDPINPLKWNVVARTRDVYRYGSYDWSERDLVMTDQVVRAAVDSPEWRQAKRDPEVWGLVTWMRYPAYEIEQRGDKTLVHMFDARRSGAGRRTTVTLPSR